MSNKTSVWAFDRYGVKPPEVLVPEDLDWDQHCVNQVNPTKQYVPLTGDRLWRPNLFVTGFALLVTNRWQRRQLVVIGNEVDDDWAPGDFEEDHAFSTYGNYRDVVAEWESEERDPDAKLLEALGAINVSGEAVALIQSELGWRIDEDEEWEEPDELGTHLDHLRNLADDNLVIACPDAQGYLEPNAFRTNGHHHSLPFIGNAWGAALMMLYPGPGNLEGDIPLKDEYGNRRNGPWAYNDLMVTTRERAQDEDWVDETPFLTKMQRRAIVEHLVGVD